MPDHFNAGKSAWDATIQRDATLRPSTSEHTYYNTSGREPPRSGIVNLNADRQKYVNDQFIEQMLKEKEKSKLPGRVLTQFRTLLLVFQRTDFSSV